MNVSNLLAIVSAEMRSCRRLIRTWVFVAIAFITSGVMWLWLCLAHGFTSYVSPSAGLLGPHFVISNMGSVIVFLFSIGIVFLAFDVRSRDIRDRIQEAVDTRPMSNFELLSGRLLGVVLLLAIPAAALILTVSALGFLAEVIGFRFGAGSEPASVIAFLVWDIVPNLLLWGSLTVFVSVVVRFRLIVVVILGGLLFGYFTLSNRIPFFLASVLSTFSGSDAFPSALAPQLFNLDIFLNRTCIAIFSVGLLLLTSAILSRQNPQGTKTYELLGGALAVGISLLGVYGLAQFKMGELRQTGDWAQYHAEYQSNSLTDIDSISGTVEIHPGRNIKLDLILKFSSSTLRTGDVRLITLNPGYQIKSLELDGSSVKEFEFESGLLKLPVTNESASSTQLRLIAKGVPDPNFAYLDSSLKWSEMDYLQAREAFRFGTQSYIFHPQFVALTPGVSWFPASGSAYGRSDLRKRPQDFFNLDIEVSVPREWIVAGPGTRDLLDEGKRTTFRFNPRNPIPELALVGSKFERRTLNLEGVEFELLLNKKHTKNLKILELVVPALKEWLSELLGKSRELGLEYPYGTLSFVEVPVSMRVYGGGWQMGSVFSPPGIQMIRESGFPIARFDYPIDGQRQNFEDESDLYAEYVLGLLNAYFQNGYDGGNPFLHMGKTFIGHQTSPEGPGAVAVDFLIDELTQKLLTEAEGYFSIPALFSGNTFNQISTTTFNSGGGFGSTPTYQNLDWRGQFSRKPSVWELMIESPLVGLDFESNPVDAYHVLLLKIGEVSELILEFGGEEKVGALLRELVSRYKGKNYGEEAFLSTAMEVDLDLESILGDWLHDLELPGFIASDPIVERLADTTAGEPVYQSSFEIRNDEPAPGVVGISYVDDLAGPEEQYLETVRIDGLTSLRIAFQTIVPPTRVVLDPYLSLNRDPFHLDSPSRDSIERSDSPILPFVTDSDWDPIDDNVVTVDDLDEGFSWIGVTDESAESLTDPMLPRWITFLFARDSTPIEMDRGMPELTHALKTLSDNPLESGRWYRETAPLSFGKYRHTHAINMLRSDSISAKFTADIPISGRWKLEFHVPAVNRKQYQSSYSPGPGTIISWSRPTTLGVYEIAVKGVGKESITDLDAFNAPHGWNDIGNFDLEAGTTEVISTPKSNGASVGDAIRWTLVEE
ncbi:MAG: hypothetical protein OXG24_08005 [Gammaproteobacteria bacterium]|nr:hypothetical protein [Gammaproteobacteria bacterium]